jgi:hypothetical protein
VDKNITYQKWMEKLGEKEDLPSFEFKNWAQTVKARPEHLHQPRNKEKIQKIIK